MLPPYKRPKAYPQPFRPPIAIRRLPLSLLRDQLYPRQPELIDQGIEDYRRYMAGEPKPQLLPQRIAFQHWKTGPDQVRRPWWHSAMSVLAMQSLYRSGVPTRVARIEQTVDYGPVRGAVVRGADMPLVSAPQVPEPVISRTIRTSRPTSSVEGRKEPPPDAFARTAEEMIVTRQQRGREKLLNAIASAHAAITRGKMVHQWR